jgi:transcriptional antiterminator RfaH
MNEQRNLPPQEPIFRRSAGSGPEWFALQVRAKHEKIVAAHLSGRDYEWFLPLYMRRRAWSDRIKVVEAPLFPGYIFCRLDLQNRLPILTTPGVIRIVGYNRSPVSIEVSEISAIQTLVASGLPDQPWPFIAAGDKVRITRGPLRGVEGILIAFKGSHRLILSVTLLQRSVAVEVDSALVVREGPIPARQREADYLPSRPIRAAI